MALDGVSSFFTLERRYKCDTAQILAEIIQCNDGKLEQAGDFKCIFDVHRVLESK